MCDDGGGVKEAKFQEAKLQTSLTQESKTQEAKHQRGKASLEKEEGQNNVFNN